MQPHRKDPVGGRTARSRWLRISLGLLLENGESAGFSEQKRELAGKTCYWSWCRNFRFLHYWVRLVRLVRSASLQLVSNHMFARSSGHGGNPCLFPIQQVTDSAR
ncbi:hypothetical protein SAMN04487895_11028 [Paenibacillus sophorae]|uniref:Uncharacterized protein n=1 Tax=Paenibacillus sophorae TaxID=1333845 RepID=A0A1H8RN63_9BACL|nr:hypothetical protein SAMN04487895_11028 [Paenibacillus sophorae]